MTIGTKLKEARKQKGLTQKQAAELLGLQCEDRISHWEKGSAVPSVKNLVRLCEVYKVDFGQILIHLNDI